MKLFDFLECFNPKTPITILDKNGNTIEKNIVGEVALKTLSQRDVLTAYPQKNNLEVVTCIRTDTENQENEDLD